MSKFMKFWLLIICFLFIFLIIFTDRVNALSYDYNIGQEISVNTSHWDRNITIASSTGNSGLTSSDFMFNQNYSFNNAKFIRFTYTSNLVTTSSTTDIINWTETCSSTQFITATGAKSYTVTYADGSHATITGNITDYEGYCSQYNTSGTVTNSTVSINNFTPQIYLMSTSTWAQCEMDNSFILCPVLPNINYTGLRLYFYKQTLTTASGYYSIYLRKDVTTITTDAQQIINNQNQNAQQQHNDSQQQYNYISNTTISNENYSNTQTISDNNTNTQTKSVVMNFWLIPLNFFNSIIASFENTCTQVCVGECGSGHDNAWRFVFPCLDIKGFVGNTIYNTIDAFFAIGMIFAFVKRAKNFFINALMLTNDVASEVSVF